MAIAIDFPERNTTYVADGCGDLPTAVIGNEIISCWKLTPEELENVNKTGVVWLSCFGSQPPVYVTGEDIFIRQGAEEDVDAEAT